MTRTIGQFPTKKYGLAIRAAVYVARMVMGMFYAKRWSTAVFPAQAHVFSFINFIIITNMLRSFRAPL